MNSDLFQHCNGDENCEEDDLYPSVKNALIRIADKEGYINYKIHKKMISSNGGNCFGMLYEINIKGETVEKNNQETNIFVKQILANADHIKLLSVSEIYNKENFIYTELANMFNDLQDKANIPLDERYKFVKIYDENNIDAIMLENLTKQGFKTYGRTELMKLDYAELCVQLLAKFHGLGFVMERRMSEYHENKIKSLKQSLVTGAAYKGFANKIYKIATKNLSSDLKLKIDKWWKTAIEDYTKYVEGLMPTVKCLCHGDFKMNNLMYKGIEGEVTEVIAVDYQLAHYGSPVLDLIYFICMGTDSNFRRKNMGHLKEYYHIALKKYLEYFDIHVDDVYPRTTFEKEFKDCLDYALLSCICVLPFSLTSEGGEPDLVDPKIVHLGLKFDDSYYDRVADAMDDFFFKCDF